MQVEIANSTDKAAAGRDWFRLGRMAPAVVLTCLLLDIGLRFLPPRFITFRAWETVTLFATGHGPFVPNANYRNMRSSGDLASLANMPQLRQYREEVFTTDAAGYRNRVAAAKPFTGILLVGDSFAAGSGISDELTLSEQLNRISGHPVYNGAETKRFWQLVQSLEMKRGLVVWQQSERTTLALTTDPQPGWKHRLIQRAIGDEGSEAMVRMTKYVTALWSYSPLQILFGRAVKSLQDDKILPNPYRERVLTGKLRNGREMLFLMSEVKNYQLDRPTNTEDFVQLKKQLEEKGLGLLVLLVPDKYVVYHDLLSPALPQRTAQYLDLVEQRLTAVNIPVLNLTSLFRKQAGELLDKDEYLYWMDDTHWNGEGIREAAQAIADTKAVAECACQ